MTNLLKGDFHLHTEYSVDCRSSLQDILLKAKKYGLDCLAVTDHDEIEGAIELERLSLLHGGPKIIIGEEVSSEEGHIIGLFIQEKIEPGLSVIETAGRIREQGGLVVAPHPFSRLAGKYALQSGLTDNPECFDIIEVANANNLLPSDDTKALKFAVEYNLPVNGGSDAHLADGIGRTHVELEKFNGPEEYLENLRTATIVSRKHPISYLVRATAEVMITLPDALSHSTKPNSAPRSSRL